MTAVFQSDPVPPGSETSQNADQTEPNLKMPERPDWALFRTVEGLSQRGGVAPSVLRRLVLKELADNALDAGGQVEAAAKGEVYSGRSSPWWYDAVHFYELVLAHGEQPLRALIAQLDGCTGGKAGEVVAAAGLERMTCANVSREQATVLLTAARKLARPVTPQRLGSVGRAALAYGECHYAIAHGSASFGSAEPKAEIPFAVEAWAQSAPEAGVNLNIFVNRTPVTGEFGVHRRNDNKIVLLGCGLGHSFLDAPTRGNYAVTVNILTPFCPVTSDGKAPNLKPFVDEIVDAITKVTKKVRRDAAKEKRVSQKEVVLENLDAAIASVSGDGAYRFNERQILYVVRPTVLQETGRPLSEGNFKSVITDFEAEHGEIPLMYREPRGSIYHPHRKETITLGTLMVEEYERPAWLYKGRLYRKRRVCRSAQGRWLGRAARRHAHILQGL
jgi:hypothetical protein